MVIPTITADMHRAPTVPNQVHINVMSLYFIPKILLWGGHSYRGKNWARRPCSVGTARRGWHWDGPRLLVSVVTWHDIPCWMRAQPLSCVWLFAIPWTVTHQAPLSLRFSRQEYWSGFPFPTPGDLPDPRYRNHFSGVSCIGRQIFCHWTTREAHTMLTALHSIN